MEGTHLQGLAFWVGSATDLLGYMHESKPHVESKRCSDKHDLLLCSATNAPKCYFPAILLIQINNRKIGVLVMMQRQRKTLLLR